MSPVPDLSCTFAFFSPLTSALQMRLPIMLIFMISSLSRGSTQIFQKNFFDNLQLPNTYNEIERMIEEIGHSSFPSFINKESSNYSCLLRMQRTSLVYNKPPTNFKYSHHHLKDDFSFCSSSYSVY